MDKQHAKFILQSYRPDGADAADPDFKDALQLAAEDRELGQWLAHERSHDIIFVEALEQVNIPDVLKDEILEMMGSIDAEIDMSSEMDALFAGAIAHQSPPPGLRDQIISAMEVESKAMNEKQTNVIKFPNRWLNVAGIAAVALLAFTFIYTQSASNSEEIVDISPGVQSEVDMISMKAGMVINASNEIELPTDSFVVVNTWLEKEGMPVAKTVPEALVSYDVEGGKKITFDNGIEGSLIFFKDENAEEYYLVVVDLDSVKNADNLSNLSNVGIKNCYDCPVTNFSITQWKDSSEAYFLLTKSDEKNMLELF